MTEWEDEGIVLSVRPHGETGGVVSLLTRDHGRAVGYVYGAVSTRTRATLEPGTLVSARWQAKSREQLGTFTLELEKSHTGSVLDDSLKLTALQSACVLADKTLPEREKHAGVFEGLKVLLSVFGTEIWPAAYIYWELGLLKELGFGLDLSKCVATGESENLIYVSPKSGCAVSAAAGFVYKEKMLQLPPFLRGESGLEDVDILNGLRLTGHFLLHRVFSQANTNLPEPRLRLEDKYGQKVFKSSEPAAVS
jgi:DNA repair protein RecO (recombination protein O)